MLVLTCMNDHIVDDNKKVNADLQYNIADDTLQNDVTWFVDMMREIFKKTIK